MDLPVSAEDYVYCHLAPPRAASQSSNLLLHFYVKKVDEQQVLEAERAAVTAAIDHGNEVTPAAFLGGGSGLGFFASSDAGSTLQVLGMVRVPLYSLRDGRGLGSFLSHGFISNARTQLVDSLLRLELVSAKELHRAHASALKTNSQTGRDLKAGLAMIEAQKKHY